MPTLAVFQLYCGC